MEVIPCLAKRIRMYNTHHKRWLLHPYITRVSTQKMREPQLTLLDDMERISAIDEGLSRELARQGAIIESLEQKNSHIESLLWNIGEWLDVVIGKNLRETGNILKRESGHRKRDGDERAAAVKKRKRT
jgi:hypothetical protein